MLVATNDSYFYHAVLKTCLARQYSDWPSDSTDPSWLGQCCFEFLFDSCFDCHWAARSDCGYSVACFERLNSLGWHLHLGCVFNPRCSTALNVGAIAYQNFGRLHTCCSSVDCSNLFNTRHYCFVNSVSFTDL